MLLQSFKDAKLPLQYKFPRMKNLWWLDLSSTMQVDYNSNDSKALHQLIKQVFGPKLSSVETIKSQDGSAILKDADDVINKRTKYFTELFYNP